MSDPVPVHQSYMHEQCGKVTVVGLALAETYASPSFDGVVYCAHCMEHFPASEFVWKDTQEKVGS